MTPPDSESVTFGSKGTLSAREAAARLGLGECRVIQLCRRGTLQARHAPLADRSQRRRRWLVEAASVEQLAIARGVRPDAEDSQPRRARRHLATVPGMISPSEAAAKLGIRDDSIYRSLRRGYLQGGQFDVPVRHGSKRCILIYSESLDQLLARRSVPKPSRQPPRPRRPHPRLPFPPVWDGSDTFSVDEAAESLCRSVPYIYTLCRTGRLKKRLFPRLPPTSQMAVRVTKCSVLAFRDASVAAVQLRPDPGGHGGRATKKDLALAAPADTPGETSALPPGHLHVRQTADATGLTPHILIRLFRAGLVRGGVTVAGKVLIEVASVAEHQEAARSPLFWTPARTRSYREAAPSSLRPSS